jgi:hypothetical protein
MRTALPPWHTTTIPPDGCWHSHPAGQFESAREPPPLDDAEAADVVGAGDAGVDAGSEALVVTVLTRATDWRG